MKTAYWIGAVVIVLLVLGFIVKGNSSPKTMTPGTASSSESVQTATTTTNSTGQGSAPASGSTGTVSSNTSGPKIVTVTYDGSSFSPSTVTIHIGDTIKFVDSSANPMWVASNVHPSHTQYDGTAISEHCAAGYAGPAPFDECGISKATYSFTFTKAGTWSYHNHLNVGASGNVVVK
jgi:plastocyanin